MSERVPMFIYTQEQLDVAVTAARENERAQYAAKWYSQSDMDAAVAAAEQQAGEQAHGHYMDGYNAAWSLSAAEIERQVREEEQVAQTLARAELYSMEEMDERCTQAADEAFAAAVGKCRDAVAACIHGPGGYHPATALAAIDALRTEKP